MLLFFVYSEHLQLYVYIWCELLTESQYDWNTIDFPHNRLRILYMIYLMIQSMA